MRLLLPQLLFIAEILDLVCSQDERISCTLARIRCLHRQTCRDSYITFTAQCSSFFEDGDSSQCRVGCRDALVGLLSSEAGDDLFHCQCQDDDDEQQGSSVGGGGGAIAICGQVKERMDMCREDVMRILHPNVTISCTLAELVCLGDTSCAVAMQYYHKFCRKMFEGHSCSLQCKNSLDILLRQERALKLRTCYCDGREAYACSTVQQNMAALCLHSPSRPTNPPDEITNLIPLDNDQDNEVVPLEREEYKPRPRYTHIRAAHPPRFEERRRTAASSAGQMSGWKVVCILVFALVRWL